MPEGPGCQTGRWGDPRPRSEREETPALCDFVQGSPSLWATPLWRVTDAGPMFLVPRPVEPGR